MNSKPARPPESVLPAQPEATSAPLAVGRARKKYTFTPEGLAKRQAANAKRKAERDAAR